MRGVIHQRLVLSLAVVLFSFPAWAQTQTGLRDRDPVLSATKQIATDLQKANFHYGPWYLLSSIQLADIGYTDQFYVPTGEEEGTVSFGVRAPQRLYFVPRKKTVYSLEVSPGYTFLRGGRTNHQTDYLVRGDAQYLLNHLYLDVYGLQSDQITSKLGEINRLATLKTQEYGVNGEVKYSSRTSMLFRARENRFTYPTSRFQPTDVPIALLDRNEDNFRAALMHKTWARTSLTLAGERSNYRFRTALSKDSSRNYVGAGFLHDTGRFSARLEAGPTTLRFKDRTQKDFSGVTGSFDLGRSVGQKWRFTLLGARDVDFALFAANNYYVANRGAAVADWALTRRFSLRGSSSVERDTYDVPIGGILRRDTTWFDTVGFRYRFRYVQTGFDVGYYDRNSNLGLPGEDVSGIRYLVHLSFTP